MHEGTKLRSGVIQRKKGSRIGDKGSRTITCGRQAGKTVIIETAGAGGNVLPFLPVIASYCARKNRRGQRGREKKKNRGRMKRSKWREGEEKGAKKKNRCSPFSFSSAPLPR